MLDLITPDTSPRGAGIAGESDSWDFGLAAGFYADAAQAPWNARYRMYNYVLELLQTVIQALPVDSSRVGIFGHSMGGPMGRWCWRCSIRVCSARYLLSRRSARPANALGERRHSLSTWVATNKTGFNMMPVR